MGNFKVRRKVQGTGGATFGSGTAYTAFSQTGVQSMVGNARVKKDIWVPATNFFLYSASFASGSGAMAYTSGSMALVSKVVNFGTAAVPVWSGCAAASAAIPVMTAAVDVAASMVYASTVVPRPDDADTSGCIEARLVWGVVAPEPATTGSVFCFKAGLGYLTTSGSLRVAASLAACPAYTATTASNFFETSLGSFPSWGSTDSFGLVTVGADQGPTADTGGSGFAILGLKLRYYANVAGSPV
jgi:hypothetical protein